MRRTDGRPDARHASASVILASPRLPIERDRTVHREAMARKKALLWLQPSLALYPSPARGWSEGPRLCKSKWQDSAPRLARRRALSGSTIGACNCRAVVLQPPPGTSLLQGSQACLGASACSRQLPHCGTLANAAMEPSTPASDAVFGHIELVSAVLASLQMRERLACSLISSVFRTANAAVNSFQDVSCLKFRGNLCVYSCTVSA